MQIVVLANEELKKELTGNGVQPGVELVWINSIHESLSYPKAAALIDLLFEKEEERMNLLEQNKAPVIINSVEHTLKETNPSFIRINGWNTLLKSTSIEGAADDRMKQIASNVFATLNKKTEWLSDEPGFVTPRVISAIINEAFIALEQGVSSIEEINTAMKLGTNYPYGPFEWSEKIGLKKIASLLKKLSGSQTRYSPCPLLVQQAG